MDKDAMLPFSGGFRNISTSSLEALGQFQAVKNRRYTQLQPGELKADYMEAALGRVQVFREKLSLGVRLEAAPPDTIVPFGVASPESGDFRFCGYEGGASSIAQATGGDWDLCTQRHMDYYGCAFEKDYFLSSCQALLNHEVPDDYFLSLSAPTTATLAARYVAGVRYMLNRIHRSPELLDSADIVRLISSEIFKLVIEARSPDSGDMPSLKKLPKRIKGAKRVAEYIHENAIRLPDMQTLCRVANLSERSLQYGFMEYLGVTPIQYLRLVRLNGARTELLGAAGRDVKVYEVALSWGFIEFGRFSKEYRQLFSELPSQTLRRSGA